MRKVFACFGLIIALYSCKSGNTGSPKDTVKAFFEAGKKGNIDDVKKYLSRSDVAILDIGQNALGSLSPEARKSMMDKISEEMIGNMKNTEIEVKEEKIDGNNATVTIESTKDGRSETGPLGLIKEDGQWKISLMSSIKNRVQNNPAARDAMKDINVDSLKNAIDSGMEEFKKMDNDSLKKVIDEGMKEVEKLKELPKKN